MISKYVTAGSTISSIIYAPAPIIGGTSAPPELAAASIPPATVGRKPVERINGMVNVPVVAVLATALPERDPIIPEEITATLAGPPVLLRKMRRAVFKIYPVAPVSSSTVPKSTKRKT